MSGEGRRSIALQSLVRMVAASSSFRNRCEVESHAEALDHIFYPYVIDPDAEHFPRAIITMGALKWSKDAGGAQNYLLPAGAFTLWLHDDTDNSDPQAALVDFTNFVDDVLADLAGLAGQDDYL